MEVIQAVPKRPRGRPRKISATELTALTTPEGRILVPRQPDTEFFSTLPPGFTVPRRADYLGDVLIRTQEYQTDAQKVIWLRHNASNALTYLLRVAFCKGVEWLIPPGLPVFKPWKGKRYSAPSELKRELRRLYLFLRGGNDAVKDLKRQKVFQELIEGLEQSELSILLAVKDHTLEADYGITADIVTLAFPGILDATFNPKFIR